MAAPPVFVRRVARIPALVAALSAYPGGLTLGELAAQFDADPATIREDLTTYLDLESWGWSFDLFRRPVIEFVHTADDEADAADAVDEETVAPDADTVVRVLDDGKLGLGVEHLSAGDLATIYTAGLALLDIDTEDSALADALGVISETMYGAATAPPAVPQWNRFLPVLKEGQSTRRRVRIVYSRMWHEGVGERVIEPHRLIQTRRGWEVDAGPVGPEGNLRTFLLANVRDAEVLEETFSPPVGLEGLLARQRRTSTVRLALAQDARWAADMYAESVHVIDEDEDELVADLDLLPPVGGRVGLIMLASGDATRILEPTTVLPDALDVIEELVRHHEGARDG